MTMPSRLHASVFCTIAARALLAALSSCGGASSPPPVVVATAKDAAPSDPGKDPPDEEASTASDPGKDPHGEEASTAQDVPGCFMRQESMTPCYGAQLPEPPAPQQVKVCDGCRSDDDCTAVPGGRCVKISGNPCQPGAFVCRYLNDECSQFCSGRGGDGSGCFHDGQGHARCQKMVGRPGRAPPGPQ
jgi:hypothetical protein